MSAPTSIVGPFFAEERERRAFAWERYEDLVYRDQVCRDERLGALPTRRRACLQPP